MGKIMPVNAIETNKLTSLVMLRFLTNAPYLTVGSKKYFSDQLVGKRNGQTYEFVIRDRAQVNHGLNQSKTVYAAATSAGSPTTAIKTKATRTQLVEKRVEMSLEDFNIFVSTDAIEKYTDLNWEDEVAKPQGAALAQDVTRTYVERNFPKAATVIVGSGFQPLAEAGAHLEDISSEKIFGFVDSKIQAILTSNGQQFNPVGSPSEFYAKGLLGTFHDVEYRSQRFIPKLKISTALKTVIEGASAAAIGANSNYDATHQDPTKTSKCPFVLNLTVTSGQYSVKAGTPIYIEGLVACDLIGDATDSPFYFIVGEDVNMASAGTTLSLPIGNIFYDSVGKNGTRVFAKEGGDGFSGNITTAAATAGSVNAFIDAQIDASVKVTTPLAADKTYFCGQLRLDGAMEFETLNKFDASNAETKAGEVLGFMMFENRVVDIDEMINDTRWDVVAMAGIVDPRACVNIYTTAS